MPKPKRPPLGTSPTSPPRRRKAMLPLTESKQPVGAPPAPYHPDYWERAKTLSIAGFTQERMAQVFGVSMMTFQSWIDKNPEFLAAINFGRDHADAIIERSLFESAKGYKLKKKRFDVLVDGEGAQRVKVTEYEEDQVPHPTSMVFYLSNRQRSRYQRSDPAPVRDPVAPDAIARAAQAAIAALRATVPDEEDE